MPAKLLLMLVLLFALQAQAAETEMPLDLIELLGELDDEDNESLNESLTAAMSEIESNSSKETPHTKEVKK